MRNNYDNNFSINWDSPLEWKSDTLRQKSVTRPGHTHPTLLSLYPYLK